MTIPVAGEVNSDGVCSNPNLTRNDLNPNSAEDNFIASQLVKSSNSQPLIPYDPSPSKPRKSKPTRFKNFQTNVQMENPPPKINIVVTDAPGASSSLQKHTSPTKTFKAQVLSSPSLNRAMELKASLGNEFPSCIKVMRGSQVSKGFWLGIPRDFCESFLPKEDVTCVLEDESGEQYEVKFLAHKHGISAGWTRFVVGHKLMEGDVLLFHLVEATKFKVYITKANVSSEVANSVPVNLSTLEAHSEQITPATSSPKTKKNKHPESLSLTSVEKKVKKHRKSTTPSTSEPRSGHLIGHVGNNNEEVGSAVPERSRPPIPNLSFQEVKSFEDFRIVVNGHSIDAELIDDVRMGYYKLCFYKSQFLHDGVEDNMNSMLVVGMITEIVRIGNEIKKCKSTTTKEEFEKWDKSLMSFEGLGMKVGFLRDKIHTLARLVFESEGALDRERCTEAEREHERVKAEANEVAAKLLELKKSAKKCEETLGILKQKAEKYALKFKEEVNAPW